MVLIKQLKKGSPVVIFVIFTAILKLALVVGVLVGVFKIPQSIDFSFKNSYSTQSLYSDPAFNLTLNPKKKIIILLTSFRSGSTFLGQIFDSNAKLQYLYEPFLDGGIRRMHRNGEIVGARPDHTEADLRMLYLQQIMHNCSVHLTNFPERYERCGTPEENLIRFNSTECGNKYYRNGENVYQEVCRLRDTTVLKVIRLKNIADLMRVEQIKSANVKIIHLIRHPVPLMMSRRYGGWFFMWDQRFKLESDYLHFPSWRVKVALEMFEYCADIARTIASVKTNSWLKDRYMMVSHHEMSLKPHRTAEKIYNFVEEALTNEIKTHLTEITGANSGEFKEESGDALAVHKNSAEISDKWKELGMYGKYWNLFSVELQCRQVYDLLNTSATVDNISRSKALRTQSDIADRNLFSYINVI